MKHEWKKEEKQLYVPGTKPSVVDVPKLQFAMISGEGDPNGDAFAGDVGALYALSYGIRMMPKSGFTPPGYEEYTVYPLEGV